MSAFSRGSHWIGAVATLVVATSPVSGQQPAAARPAFKGIWEPVSFSEDINLRHVFFVTADVGWAAGAKGTIIHTRDGGATWTAQAGGDPQAAEPDIDVLTFLDERTGWAARGNRVLRTSDGESWEDLGKAPFDVDLLVMTSPTDGVAEGEVGMGTVPSTLFKTTDGGKTWKPVTTCSVKAQVQGLTRELTCQVQRIQFVSPTHGWLVAQTMCFGMGCNPPPILGKTEDGGDSWTFFLGGGDPEVVGATDLFFLNETTGVVRLTDDKLALTTDGGQSWKGLLATVGGPTRHSKILFADPEVGWALEEQKVSYTTDGGLRWNSRALRFPDWPRDWSYPRRDRAYVVGDHGMVFRYRVVPGSEPVKPNVMVAPAMPAFASPLDSQVSEFQTTVAEVTAALEKAPPQAGASTTPVPSSAPDPVFTQDEPTAFVNACCGRSVNKLSVVLGAVLQSLPQFVAKYKNTNLLAAALRMVTTMPAQLGELRNALKAFRGATDKEAAKAALAQLTAAASALHQSTQAAFQKEVRSQ